MSNINEIYTKKKKIKPKAKPIGNIRIVDDDVTVAHLIPDNINNTLEEDLYKSEPTIAEYIDERPEIIKQLELYTSDKWKRVIDKDNIEQFVLEVENKSKKESNNDQEVFRKSKKKKIDNEEYDAMTGRNEDEEEVDETKVRVRKIGAKEQMEKNKKEEKKLKYMEWGKGLVQKKNLEQKLDDHIHEASKPLARYKDDEDLDELLKHQEREDDPMLPYIKKSENNEEGKEVRKYRGAAPAPNRFKISPGYRWDGVDRSNGFEKRYQESLANKKAMEIEAYKWSVEDM